MAVHYQTNQDLGQKSREPMQKELFVKTEQGLTPIRAFTRHLKDKIKSQIQSRSHSIPLKRYMVYRAPILDMKLADIASKLSD